MNFSRSSMGLHTFQGFLRPPQKAPLCYPCVRNELLPFSQEGQPVHPGHMGSSLGRNGLGNGSILLSPLSCPSPYRPSGRGPAAAKAKRSILAALLQCA